MGAYLHIPAGEQVKLGSVRLPGVVQGVQVAGDLQIDEQDLENTHLKSLAVLGYTTQRVTVTLVITGDTEADVARQVGQIQQAFQVDRVKGAGAKLIPVRIVSPHTDARRVKVVVFDSFTSRETDDLEVTCTLQFHEYESDVARLQQRVEEEEKRRKKEAEAKAKSGGKDGKGGGSGGGDGSGGPNGTPTPPGGGKDTAGGNGSSAAGTSGTGGVPPFAAGFAAGSGAAASLIGGR